MKKEKLFRALGDIGADLIEMADTRSFTTNGWRRWGALAASIAVVLCLSVLALPYFPIGCGSSAEDANMSQAEVENDTAQWVPDAEEADDAVPEDAPETTEEEDTTIEDEAETPEASPVQTVTFDGHRYDVTERYTPEELTEQDIGAYLGMVEDASDESWIGCAVYSFRENQNKAILVKLPDGYLYCTIPLE